MPGVADGATGRPGHRAVPTPPWPLLSALAVLLLALVASGITIQQFESRRLRRQAESQLDAVARLEVDRIAAWRQERIDDAAVLTESPALPQDLLRFLARDSPESRRPILARFRSLADHHGYDDVLLVDARGRVRLSLSGTARGLQEDAHRLVLNALRTREARLTELYAGPDGLPPHIDAIAPLFAGDPTSGEPVGAILLRSLARRSLYPLFSIWPVPSRTAESLLVRRQGGGVLFLNDLRHRRDAGLRLRIPLDHANLPARMAVLGGHGIVRGKDYRGVDVLAAVYPVPGSPWFMVAKVDAAEALAASRLSALLIGALVAVLALATLVAFLAYWQHTGKRHFRRLYQAERGRVESEARYRSLFEHMVEGFAHCRMLFEEGEPVDFAFLDVNPAFEALTGLRDVVGRRVTEVIPGIRESNPELFAAFGRVAGGSAPETLESHVEPLGIWFHVSVYSPLDGEFVAVFQNVGDRKRSEQALRESQEELQAMFDVASIGIAQADPAAGRWVRVNRKMCEITGYSADEMLAMRISDITHPEDRQGDWEAFQRVVRGEAPSYRIEKRYLRKDGSATWVNVNMTVIRDATGRPARTIATIEDISDRKRAERALRESEAFTRAVLDNLPVGIAVNSVYPTVTFSYMNDNFLRFYRTTREGLAAPDAFWAAVYQDPVLRAEIRKKVLDDCASGVPERMHWEDIPITRRGEETSYVSSRNLPLPGSPLMISTVLDVTERKRAEEAVAVAHARLRKFVDSNAVGVAIANAQGEVLEANDYFLRLIGFSREELGRQGIDWRAVTPPEWLPADERAIGELRARGTCTPYEKEYLRRDGTRVPVLLADTVLPGPEEEIAAFVVDLSEIKGAERALRESEHRYRTVAENTYDWEYWRAPDGALLYVSPSCERITGYPASAFLADPGLMDRIVHPDDRAAFETHHGDVGTPTDSRVTLDLRIVRRDGSELWLNHSCLPVFDEDGTPTGRRGSNRDVTDRKRAEEEVLRLNQDLEERVRDRTAQLEAANKELEAFSYSVSHDLRAPLRGIDGWSLALLEDYGGGLDAQARQYLERVRAAAQRMGGLIDDMLRLARVTRAEFRLTEVDLSALAEASVDRLRAAQPGRAVEASIQPGVVARGDVALLDVVMTNLLDNAWKFSAPRDPAHVWFGEERRDGERVFFVRDDGVGFDMTYAEKLFGVFQRLHKLSEFPGTGVGLATVQRIVHRHGGRVWARAEVDGGATFWFTLREEG